jgi:hypothetical protein
VNTRPVRKNKRAPIGTRSILTAPEKRNFKRRFVNDEPGRIQAFLDAGYRIVDEETQMGDENVGQASQVGSVAHKPVGGGMNAVLMEIKDDWYQEDQDAKEAQLKEKEQGVLNDEDGNSPDQNHVYGEGVTIKTNRPKVQSQ